MTPNSNSKNTINTFPKHPAKEFLHTIYPNPQIPFLILILIHTYTHQTLILSSSFIHHMSPPKPPIAAAAPPKKPITVAQTCNQLSSFLKEKGRLRDLIIAKSDDKARMTVDLLSKMGNNSDCKEQSEKLKNLKPEDDVKKADYGGSSSSESKTSQMTIFYDGQVILLEDIPADRARDVMLAAGEHPSSTGKTEARVELDESTQAIPQRVGRDLPIARRASLHKFLAKRKDRASERAPYQLHNINNPSVDAGTSKNERNFDLNL